MIETLAIYAGAPCASQPRGPRIVGINDNVSTMKGSLAVTRQGPGGEVASVRINGPLAYQFSWYGATVWMDDLINTLQELQGDGGVKAVVLDINSPGGDVLGMSGVLDAARTLAAAKPLYAIANDMCASAAFWLATAARELVMTQTAMVGSIGIMAVMRDTSTMLTQMGIRMVPISTGKHKLAGVPGLAVDAEMVASAQQQINAHAATFIADAAAFTKLDAAAIAAMEGNVLVGQAAVNAGLASRVTTASAYIAEIVSLTVKETQMSTTPTTTTPAPTTPAPAPAPVPAPVPAAASGGGGAKVAATHAQLNEIYGEDGNAKYAAVTAGFSYEEALADCNKRLKATVNAQAEALEAAKKAATTASPAAPASEAKPQAAAPKAGSDPIPNVQPRVQGAATGKDPYVVKIEAMAKEQNKPVGAVMAEYAKLNQQEHEEYLARANPNK